MNMTEAARLLLGLRAAGWTEKEINEIDTQTSILRPLHLGY